MTELAAILCVVFAAVALAGVAYCLYRAARARRRGGSPWDCCCGSGGSGVTGR